MPPAPQGILFDLGDTLLSSEKHDLAAGLNRLIELSSHPQEIDADAFYEAGNRLLHDVLNWHLEIREYRLSPVELRFESFLRLLLERCGVESEMNLAELELEFWQAASPLLPEPGVHAVFDRLKARDIPTGVVSNTIFSGQTLERELDHHGLGDKVSFVMASADYGVRKPHADLFLTAVCKLSLEPSEVWYVGNSLEDDIVGAREAGLTPVWYTRRADDTGDDTGLQVKDWEAFLKLLS